MAMSIERRKNIHEMWLGSEEILVLPDLWVEFSNWAFCQSTHDMAKAGFHCKITANQKYIPTTSMPIEYSADKKYKRLISSEKDFQNPVHSIGTTSIRFYKPLLSVNKFSMKLRLHGFHRCPETVWSDLLCYEYYSANCTLNTSLLPKTPKLKTAEMILKQIPFSTLQEAHNKMMLEELGDFRSPKSQTAAKRKNKSSLLRDNLVDLNPHLKQKHKVHRRTEKEQEAFINKLLTAKEA